MRFGCEVVKHVQTILQSWTESWADYVLTWWLSWEFCSGNWTRGCPWSGFQGDELAALFWNWTGHWAERFVCIGLGAEIVLGVKHFLEWTGSTTESIILKLGPGSYVLNWNESWAGSLVLELDWEQVRMLCSGGTGNWAESIGDLKLDCELNREICFRTGQGDCELSWEFCTRIGLERDLCKMDRREELGALCWLGGELEFWFVFCTGDI